MRRIPDRLRKKLSKDPFMKVCIHPKCNNHPEWEHCWIYAGKQINEEWAIVPCCTYHHRGAGLDKDFNRWVSINLLTDEKISKYYKKDWNTERHRLNDKFKIDFSDYLREHLVKCLKKTL